MQRRKSFTVGLMALVAATGGLLFGFDTGVVSGAIPFLQQDFGIGSGQVELLTTAGLLGAILGALFGGKAADRWGRRKILLLSGLIFAVGALWSGFAPSPASLVAARLFLGLAIGTSSFAVPLYIAEISPTRIRGTLVSLFQLMVTLGVLTAYFSDYILANEANSSSWRPMFYVGVVPALILLLGMMLVPESPRWLFARGRDAEALGVLRLTEGDEAARVASALKHDVEQAAHRAPRWSHLFCRTWKTPVMIAVGIMFIQQFVGINTVMYYCPTIFQMAGFGSAEAAIGASVGVAALNVAATLLSVWFVDRIGRRKLFFIGMAGMVLSLGLLAGSFLLDMGQAGKYATVGAALLYVAFFAMSVGPLGWLIISEVFPQELRGLGSSLGSVTVWVCNSIVTFTFFKIARLLSVPGTEITVGGNPAANPAGSFLFYALVAALGIVWGYFFMPETKGISLEDIEQHWRRGGSARTLKAGRKED